MLDGASNAQLEGRLVKEHYPKLTVIRVVEHTVSLFFNDVSKIPILHQMISAHNMIYNIFCSGIYHKPRYILKTKSQEFHNTKNDIFSGNNTRISGYFMGMNRYLRMPKQFNLPYPLHNSSVLLRIKIDKAVGYIHDNKSC